MKVKDRNKVFFIAELFKVKEYSTIEYPKLITPEELKIKEEKRLAKKYFSVGQYLAKEIKNKMSLKNAFTVNATVAVESEREVGDIVIYIKYLLKHFNWKLIDVKTYLKDSYHKQPGFGSIIDVAISLTIGEKKQ